MIVERLTDSKSSEPSATTSFTDDANVVVSKVNTVTDLDAGLLKDSSTSYSQRLVTFLQKPIVMRQGSWSGASAYQLAAISVPNEMLNYYMYSSKIDGFMAFRATLVVRLQVNANKFQQGMLLMSFYPQAQVEGTYPYVRTQSKRMLSQLPNVKLDASCDTEAILEIPYVSPTTHFNLIDATGPHGAVFLHVYSPLRYGTGSSFCEYTIWASFKDIELLTPTLPSDPFPESARRSSTSKFPLVGDNYQSTTEEFNAAKSNVDRFYEHTGVVGETRFGLTPGGYLDKLGEAGADFLEKQDKGEIVLETQMGRGSRSSRVGAARNQVDPSDQEAEDMGHGPLESVFRGINSVSNGFTNVPYLSSIAKPLSWVTGALASSAAYFGRSNPIVMDGPAKIVRQANPYVNNCDALDNSQPLSLRTDNKIEILPGFAGNDVDETSISYISSIPAWHEAFTWSTSTVSETLLKTYDLYPYNFKETGTTVVGSTTYTWNQYTPVAYMQTFFKYYKGSLKFTFRIVKTEFHSGRLAFVYAPGFSGTPADFQETSFCFRTVVDVRDSNTVNLVVPYASTTPYKQNLSSYGRLFVYVLNQLTCPDTVNNTVDIVVEVAGHSDLEFAVPTDSVNIAAFAPADNLIPFTTQSGFEIAEAQMNSAVAPEKQDPCAATSANMGIGSSGSDDAPLVAAKFCIGEKITSLLQLCKRTAYMSWEGGSPSDRTWYIRPFTVGGIGVKPSDNTMLTSSFKYDHFSLFAPLFAYNRGGIRYRFITDEGWNTQSRFRCVLSTDSDNNATLATTSNTLEDQYNSSQIIAQCGLESGASVQIPHYNGLHSRLMRISYGDSSYCEPNDIYSSQLSLRVNKYSQYPPMVGRQISDDFSMGFFLGVPPMCTQIVTV